MSKLKWLLNKAAVSHEPGLTNAQLMLTNDDLRPGEKAIAEATLAPYPRLCLLLNTESNGHSVQCLAIIPSFNIYPEMS